jgi:multiple sugar transport system permease protein
LGNFISVVRDTDLIARMGNSFVTASASVILTLALAFPAAYSMSRFGVGGRKLLMWLLSIRMLPPIVAAIPLFLVAAQLRITDRLFILPILYLTFNLPFAVWMLKSFVDEVPKEIDETARVDGCTTRKILWFLILPLTRPGILATGVFVFALSWNEFLLASIFTQRYAVTLPVSIASFVTDQGVLWGLLTAAGTLASIPPIVLLFVFQRNLIRGLTLGAVKG